MKIGYLENSLVNTNSEDINVQHVLSILNEIHVIYQDSSASDEMVDVHENNYR